MNQFIDYKDYDSFVLDEKTSRVTISDHLGGFDSNLRSPMLDKVSAMVGNGRRLQVCTEYILDQKAKDQYPNLDLRLALDWHRKCLDQFHDYKTHPTVDYKNFVCSFNGTEHMSRKFLVSILQKMGWFDPAYASKNFTWTVDELDGNIEKFVGDRERLFRKFFISDDSQEFFSKVITFDYDRFNHGSNIYSLQNRIAQSFVHIVSESLSTSYQSYHGEKALYSVVTRGLFLSYGQPRFHQKLQECYGFKKYDRLFDYRFDTIENPIERLVELISMIAKYSKLNHLEWHDLYLMEKDTVDYNYDHYFSKDYVRCLERYV
jgi:hypothetical protein